ncbi:MAG: hypothetical protein LBB24_03125 [Rickettsiales bacterium]|jgi:hypothetical protein|nr:hypothetical protein [Rickettsiales bacterium]
MQLRTETREKINISLLLFTLVSLLLTLFLWAKKQKISSHRSNFRENLSVLAGLPGSRVLNGEAGTMVNVDANDFVIFNIFSLDNRQYLNNLWISKYLLGKYTNVSVYNIVVDNSAGECSRVQSSGDDDSALERFLLRYNIDSLTICTDENTLRKYLGIDGISKIVITDRRYTVRGSFNSDVEIGLIEKFLANMGETKVVYDKSKMGGKRRPVGGYDDYLINSMDRILLIEDFNGLSAPVLAVLDPYAKRILVVKFSGEILYIVESKDFCFPRGIRYSDGKLFILDSCTGSVGYLDLDGQKLVTVKNSEHLRGATDFELLGENGLMFSRADGRPAINSLGITGAADPLGSSSSDRADSIKKFNGSFYYLDRESRILHSIRNGIGETVVDASMVGDISNFYVSTENDIYLLDTSNRKIFRCHSDKCTEQWPGQELDMDQGQLNDMVLYKNLMFILFDRSIRLVNIYTNESSEVVPYVSENTRYISDTLNNLDLTKIDRALSPDAFGALFFVGIDQSKLLNPSFLIFLRNYDGKLLVEKFINYEGLAKYESAHSTAAAGSIVYGKLYYRDSGEIRIRTIATRIVDGEGN